MEKLTITEALSEINLIKKKLDAKYNVIQSSLFRVEHLPDPYKNEGGLEAFFSKEMQSAGDLNERLLKIRSAISKANHETQVEVCGVKRTVQDWLNWKREVLPALRQHTTRIYESIKDKQEVALQRPQVYKDENGAAHVVKTVSALSINEAAQGRAVVTEFEEKLDGKLSLINATTVIEF